MSSEQEQQIAELRRLFEAGALNEATYNAAVAGIKQEASQVAAATEGGAVAQDRSTAVASRGANIGGSVDGPVVTGDYNVLGNVYVGEPTDDPREALRIYREVLFQISANLPLRGVDVGASDPRTAKKLGLANVYIDLDTTSKVIVAADEENGGVRGRTAGSDAALLQTMKERGEKERPLPTLEATIGNRWLVLTGDPGAGKSTFVNHLAFCLAAHALHAEDGWLDHLPQWPLQQAGLLPIVIPLRDFAATIDESQAGPAKPKDLWQFFAGSLDDKNLGFAAEAIERELRYGRAIVFLDGLDEVPGTRQRLYVRDAVAAFAANYPGNRFLVTCRILSYQQPDDDEEPDLRLDPDDFPVYEIAPFDEAKIDRFIDAWYAELARIGSVPAKDAQRLAGRLKEAVRRPDLWRLAPTPLLLTVMSLVHAHDQGHLPDGRALLYERTVDMLLWRWEEVKKTSGGGQKPTLRQLLSEAGRADLDLKRLLWKLAYEAHGRSDDGDEGEGLGNITQAQLTNGLVKLKREDWQWAHTMVEAMKLRAGLLLERDPGVFTFPHRTFQEYLAGAYLSTQKNFGPQAAGLGAEGPRWREPILLAAGRLVHVGGDVEKALGMVNRLCPAQTPGGESGWRNAWLAADALLEIGLQRARDDDWGSELLGRVQDRLALLLRQGRLAPRERADAANSLAELGDLRPGVVTLEPQLIPIPAGSFLMGEERHQIHITKPFAIGRTPVTNAQFRHFWQDGGYGEKWRQCWTAEGWNWRKRSELTMPRFFNRPELNLPNQPVTGVSWYEAVAYANWLAERTGRPYRLPTEAQWERAARHTDGRTYPWGEDWQDGIANTQEVGLGRPCTVGIFPGDRSKDGLLDMAGNVNEWCQTRWHDEQGQEYPLPYRLDDGREELGGGDDIWRVIKGGSYFDDKSDWPRCAYRLWLNPYYWD
ncbi:MAG: SUMF1/EgtB/PvdO family nonheme iron enzyme, partial [Chloroflexi bacterium]|nr:SUMF1/EgtB/PvdO family nonheme iron enzyme [Chloroflexota bacterium]